MGGLEQIFELNHAPLKYTVVFIYGQQQLSNLGQGVFVALWGESSNYLSVPLKDSISHPLAIDWHGGRADCWYTEIIYLLTQFSKRPFYLMWSR